jgi:hypothetical protein
MRPHVAADETGEHSKREMPRRVRMRQKKQDDFA